MNKLIITISLLIVIIVPKTAYAYPPDYDAPFIEKRYQAPEITGILSTIPGLYIIISILLIVAILCAIAFIIYKKKVRSAEVTGSAPTEKPPTATVSLKFPISRKIVIPVLVLIAIAIAIVAYLQLKSRKPQEGLQASPTPTPIPTTEERLKLLSLMPIEVKGQYIFEYEPNAQFFLLVIQNPDRDKQIRKEVVDIIKKATSSSDYCKFDVLVGGDPQKIKEHKLPGC